MRGTKALELISNYRKLCSQIHLFIQQVILGHLPTLCQVLCSIKDAKLEKPIRHIYLLPSIWSCLHQHRHTHSSVLQLALENPSGLSFNSHSPLLFHSLKMISSNAFHRSLIFLQHILPNLQLYSYLYISLF